MGAGRREDDNDALHSNTAAADGRDGDIRMMICDSVQLLKRSCCLMPLGNWQEQLLSDEARRAWSMAWA